MNTIPTTFKSPVPSYTVVGGTKGSSAGKTRGISIILLNRGGVVNRPEVLEDFEKMEGDEIISIERAGDSYAIESLAFQFPRIKFILLHRPSNPGEMINIGMDEASAGLAAVFWSDMKVPSSSFPERFLERAREKGNLCTAPWLYSGRNELVPSLFIPAFNKKRLKVLSLPPGKDEVPSLYPYDYCGIYSKERFVLLGGYDYKIENPYWQKLDFGFRGHLWGERIVCSRQFRASVTESSPPEDATPDGSYRIFFLKNLAVRFKGDRGELPRGGFLPYFLHSGCGFLTALREYRDARNWVRINTYRFRMDSQSVTELWEDPEE